MYTCVWTSKKRSIIATDMTIIALYSTVRLIAYIFEVLLFLFLIISIKKKAQFAWLINLLINGSLLGSANFCSCMCVYIYI